MKLFVHRRKILFLPNSAYIIGDYWKISRCLIKAEEIMGASGPNVKWFDLIWKRNLNAIEESYALCLFYRQGSPIITLKYIECAS